MIQQGFKRGHSKAHSKGVTPRRIFHNENNLIAIVADINNPYDAVGKAS